MSESVVGSIIDASPNKLLIEAPYSNWQRFIARQYEQVEVILTDGRQLSPRQRNAIHAMVRDITEFQSGFAFKERVFNETLCALQLQFAINTTDSEEIRYILTQNYCRLVDIPLFSLSPKKENCADMTTAHDFLGWLIDLCIEHAIPCCESLLNRAEDVGRYLYSCIAHKRCAICGGKADLHHVDTVGAGRNRKEITHLGMRAESVCRGHHTEAHAIGQLTFDQKYHLYGIEMDDRLCEIHRLKH